MHVLMIHKNYSLPRYAFNSIDSPICSSYEHFSKGVERVPPLAFLINHNFRDFLKSFLHSKVNIFYKLALVFTSYSFLSHTNLQSSCRFTFFLFVTILMVLPWIPLKVSFATQALFEKVKLCGYQKSDWFEIGRHCIGTPNFRSWLI